MTSPAVGRPAAVTFIFVTILLDMLALGMVIPVLPLIIEDFRGGDTALAARTIGLFGTVWSAIQFVASPILGSLSDRFGRRPVILLSNLGLGIDYVLMALAPTLGWLFVGRVLSGITSASIPTAFAYIADVTTPDRRARAYGLMGAAFGMGFILGPAIGGLLTHLGSARAVLGRGGVQPRERVVRLLHPAGVAACRSPRAIFVAPRESARIARPAALTPRAPRICRAARALPPRAPRADRDVRARTRRIGTAGAAPKSAGRWRALGHASPSFRLVSSDASSPRSVSDERSSPAWPAARSDLRSTVSRRLASMFLMGIPVMSLWGLYGPGGTGTHDRARGPQRAGRAAGRAREPADGHGHLRTGPVC